MFRTRFPMPGTAPATLLPLSKGCTIATTIKLMIDHHFPVFERLGDNIESLENEQSAAATAHSKKASAALHRFVVPRDKQAAVSFHSVR